jgi:hypothetical protein
MKGKPRYIPSAQEALSIELTQRAIRQLTYSKRIKPKPSMSVDNDSYEVCKNGTLIANAPGLTLRRRSAAK